MVTSLTFFCRKLGLNCSALSRDCKCGRLNLCIDIENGYKPEYTVPADKKELIEELRKLSIKADVVYLACDEGPEGETVSQQLVDELNLPVEKTRRIVFHEITQPAILKAIETPRQLDTNLVDAQLARRVLDRLVGYELSPVLWKKVNPPLSAGRVQSVAVRLLVEREREIQNFKSESSFRIVALLEVVQGGKRHIIKAVLPKKLATRAETEAFLQTCQNASFSIGSIEKKNTKRTPAAPFTTSTLLQEASRKLGYSVSQTMVLAQKLYEAGKITYMRTDSVNLSETALEATKAQIDSQFGPRYHKQRTFANK